MILHHTFSLGESRSDSQIPCGFSEPHILKLCLFSNPETWNVDLSLKQTRFKNLKFESNLSSIVTANSFRRRLSSGLTLFSSTAGFLKPGLCKNGCNYFIFLGNILEFFDFSEFELLNKMVLFLGAPEQKLTEKIDVF